MKLNRNSPGKFVVLLSILLSLFSFQAYSARTSSVQEILKTEYLHTAVKSRVFVVRFGQSRKPADVFKGTILTAIHFERLAVLKQKHLTLQYADVKRDSEHCYISLHYPEEAPGLSSAA